MKTEYTKEEIAAVRKALEEVYASNKEFFDDLVKINERIQTEEDAEKADENN